MYAEVAVDAPVQSTFHYHIPPELAGKLQTGHLVQVAFGTALQHGIVLGLRDTTPIEQTKPIHALLDPLPVVTPRQIELAQWLSREYLAPLGACLWLMLPPGMSGERDMRVRLQQDEIATNDPTEQKVISLLQRRGELTGSQLDSARALQGEHWQTAVERLTKAGILHKERILKPPRHRPKMVQTAALAINPTHIPYVTRQLGRESRRADILEVLAAMRAEKPTIEQVLAAAGAPRAALNQLAKDGIVTLHKDEKPPKVSLTIPRYEVDAKLVELRNADKPLHILKVLAREAEPMDVSWVYAQTDAKLEDLKRLEEAGLILLGEKQTWRDSLAERDFIPAAGPQLTPEQRQAWAAVEGAIKGWKATPTTDAVTPSPPSNLFLLHGVTGSGKTEIYLRAIELTLAQGRQAIFLVPEIALTAQTLRRVAARFPGQVAVVHSGLSEGERYDTWRRAREGLFSVVVGARSALFTPLPDVGLVILDEEHDDSYKQSPPINPPYYHARAVAEEMMRQNNGVLILGSATPDLETVYRTGRGELQLLTLPTRIMGHRVRILEQSEREGVAAKYYPVKASDALAIDLPPVKVVDMRDELKAGNTSIFSRELQMALTQTLERQEQVILFINRRGASTYVFCRDCGYVALCPRCDSPLTYHQQGEALRCHLCGYQGPQPQSCPQCSSNRIKYFGAGTQQVEQALKEHFPAARVVRWDADTASNPAMHELYLQRFIDRQADVMVGTQMVAKGLDLPLVTLVGVVSADMGLNLPDYRACERTFQVLTQVAGRAGRGLLGGRVVLQTYQPDHYIIQAASKHDFSGFYEREIAYRRELGYPPFRRLVRLLFRYATEGQARSEAERAADYLRHRMEKLRLTGTELIGPAPCFFSKVNNDFRWHLLIRGTNPTLPLEGMDIARGWFVDIDPVDVL